MPEKPLTPPPMHPDEPPFVCVQINQFWIPYIIGLLRPAKFPEYWSGTLAENRNARRDVQNLITQFQLLEECDDMASSRDCCVDIQIINRVNVTNGQIQISIDNGVTWQPSPTAPVTLITEPPPAVTSGVAANKCDAATNAHAQIEGWITHTSEAFDVAVTLLEFGLQVILAILSAILAILTVGALTAAEIAFYEAMGWALTQAWNVGKEVFDAYWTVDVRDQILCSLFCTIGDNGAWTDGQFQALYSDLNARLPAGIPKSLFLAFIGSVQKQGVNSMAASGATGDADCSDCNCTVCDVAWEVWAGNGEINEVGENYIIITSSASDEFGGQAVAITSNDSMACCYLQTTELLSGNGGTLVAWQSCGDPILVSGETLDHTGLTIPCTEAFNTIGFYGGTEAFQFKITFMAEPCSG